MKRLKIIIAFCLVFYSSLQADELSTLIDGCLRPFSKTAQRTDKIDTIIREALDTPSCKWMRIQKPRKDKFEFWCSYCPESEPNNKPKITFQYSELHHAKHPSWRTLDGFIANEEQSTKEINYSSPGKTHERDGSVMMRSIFCTDRVISRTPNSLYFETTKVLITQKCLSTKSKPNFLGQIEEETTPSQSDIAERTPAGYLLQLLIDLGEGEFRQYTYWAEKIVPSEAEKTYLLQLFEYMEAQIKNVSI